MKNLFLIFHFLVLGSAVFAQQTPTKIKIKRQQALYKATLCGIDSGYASVEQVVKEKKLKVNNPQDGLRIYAYQASLIGYDSTSTVINSFSGTNAKLTDDLIKALQKDYPTKLAFRKILAFNSFNETIQLNDVVINFVTLK